MIWIIRLFLLVMGLTYFAIGVWAIFDSMFDFLPSFTEAVGLSVTSEIAYSEIGAELTVKTNENQFNCKIVEKPFYDPKKKIASN